MPVTIPTQEENYATIRAAVRDEMAAFFSTFQLQPQPVQDEIGKGAGYASKIIGKAIPTIYDLVHKGLIPHSKRGKDLYFSRSELIAWLKAGKRKTQEELAIEAETFNPKNTTRKSIIAR